MKRTLGTCSTATYGYQMVGFQIDTDWMALLSINLKFFSKAIERASHLPNNDITTPEMIILQWYFLYFN